MRALLVFLLLAYALSARSQNDTTTDTIRVCFLYGSKPKRAFSATEHKDFGGLHGGHVSIQYHDTDYGFEPTGLPVHVFPRRQRRSAFVKQELYGQARYSHQSKTATFVIPVTLRQLAILDSLHAEYCKKTPYDYAFFGMRCAAATRHLLGQIGVLEPCSKFESVCSNFYPKPLRRRVFKLAAKKGYDVIQTTGKTSRVWEKD